MGSSLDVYSKKGQEASSEDDGSENEGEQDDIEDENTEEEYEMHSNTIINVITANTTIAIFSPENAVELFYLCKVLNFGIAEHELKDENDHVIPKGSQFIEAQYYEKKSEQDHLRTGFAVYKLLKNSVYVQPTQVMSPLVNASAIGNVLHLPINEYQWLSDTI